MRTRQQSLAHIALAMLITSCTQPEPTVFYPMFNDKAGGPFQMVTYEEAVITVERVGLDKGELYTELRSVYVNGNSQFVYKDDSPITTFRGENLYWSSEGYIVSDRYNIIPESDIFTVGGKAMPYRTPMMLKETLVAANAQFTSATDVNSSLLNNN